MSLIFALGNIIHNSFCFDGGFVLERCLNRHCSMFLSKKADQKPLLCSWSRMGYEVSSCGIFSQDSVLSLAEVELIFFVGVSMELCFGLC